MLRKRHSRFISWSILICILLTGLTSCSKDSKGKNTTKTEQNISTEQSAPSELNMKTLQDIYPDKKVLTWVSNDFVSISQEQNAAINDVLSEKGYDFVIFFRQISEDSYQESINSLIDSGTPPDIISASIGQAGTLQGTYRAVKNNWLEDLDSYLSSENGQKLKEAFPDHLWKTFYTNGKLFGVSGLLPINTNYTYYVNTDLANQYKINMEDLSGLLPEELSHVLQKVYDKDGKEDYNALILNEKARIANYIPLFDIYNNQCQAIVTDLQSEEPKAVNIFEQDYAIQYFRTMADYATNGYINSAPSSSKNFFLKIGYNNLFDTTATETIENLKKKYPECINITAINYAPYHLITAGNTVTGICNASNNKDTALEAVAVSVTDSDIGNLLLYGIEGIDYKLTTEGKIEQVNPLSWFASAYFGNPLITTPTTDEPTNKKEIITDAINQMALPPQLGLYFDFQAICEELATLEDVVTQYNGLFNGEYEDVDATLLELNAELYENGLEDVMNEINRQFNELLSNQ